MRETQKWRTPDPGRKHWDRVTAPLCGRKQKAEGRRRKAVGIQQLAGTEPKGKKPALSESEGAKGKSEERDNNPERRKADKKAAGRPLPAAYCLREGKRQMAKLKDKTTTRNDDSRPLPAADCLLPTAFEERRAVSLVDRRVRDRRAFDSSGRRVRDRRSSLGSRLSVIVNLCAEHPSLAAFVENQIVLGRSTQEIVQEVGIRFGLKVSNAAVTAYRNNLAWTETRAVEQTVEESREHIGRLIDEMETDGGAFFSTIAALWHRVRRWLAGTGNRDEE
jgi:hypothetical protein